jgi:probable F420-dependent oxidoreductase
MFRVWAGLDIHLPLAEVGAAARRAEALGYDGIAVPDVAHDGLLGAAAAIQATERIRVATSALVCFARSPMTVAVAAWDLQALSKGRFGLGLGPLVAPVLIEKYSTPWFPPAPRMREYVGSLRAIFDCWQKGAPLEFRGAYYRFTRQQDYTRPAPIEHPEIPIHLAAIGPRMSALAGELAAAVMTHPTNASPRYLREVMRKEIAKGARRTGRAVSDIEIIANPLCAVGASLETAKRRRERHRALLAILFSTPNYWPSLELFGWKERGEHLRRLAREGRFDRMASALDDEMLDAFVPTATYDEIPDLLREHYAGLADGISFGLPEDPAEDEAVARVVDRLHGG